MSASQDNYAPGGGCTPDAETSSLGVPKQRYRDGQREDGLEAGCSGLTALALDHRLRLRGNDTSCAIYRMKLPQQAI